MGIFNTFSYNDGTLYGSFSKLEFSVSPFTAVAITNSSTYTDVENPKVELSWSNPSGDVFGFRIIRNQEGFSETAEDGHKIYETFEPPLPPETVFTDVGYSIPLSTGKYAYYTIWLLMADNTWYPAAASFTLIPKNHNMVTPDGVVLQSSEYKMAGLLPRAFTSQQKTPLDEIDRGSDLYHFLGGVAYTLDELLTYADLLAPSLHGGNNNPNFVMPFAYQLGLPFLPNVSLKTQKRLIREAAFISKNKGTVLGIGSFVEAITGFAPTVSTSPNLLLNAQESTFYNGVGRWKNVSTNLTLTATVETGTPSGEEYAVDSSWSGKYSTLSTAGTSWLLGYDNPRLEGIPVKAETEYTFSLYAKGTGTGTTGLRVFFFDKDGEQISNYEPTYENITSTWTKYSYDYTTPEYTAFIALQIALNSPQSSKNYYWDMVQVAETSDPRSADYHEARAAEIYLAPNKINWIHNPSFSELGVPSDYDWVFNGADDISFVAPTTVPGILDSSHMVQVDVLEDAELEFSVYTTPVPTGRFYTFSVYAKTDSASETMDLVLSATNELLEPITIDETAVSSTSEIVITDSWQRFSQTLFVPNTGINTLLYVTLTSPAATGSSIFLDAAQLEQGYTTTDYFDGDYLKQGAYWNGTDNSSVSFMYSGKSQKLGNLQNQLPSYLPMNTAYVVTLGLTDSTEISIKGFSS